MHKPNEAHRQKRLFSFLNLLPKGMRARIENSIFPLFYEEVFCKIDEQLFAPLYSEKASRPNCPVNILVGLEILKHLFNLSDKQLFDTYARDIGYKLALGLQELAEGDISLRTLYNFRNRVVAYDQEHGVDLMLAVFERLTARFIEKAGVSTDIIKTDMTMLIVDGGYAGEEMREKVNEKGLEFIETGLKGQAPKYNSAAFDIDETKGILRCPMGKEPIRTWMKNEKAHALFSHGDCTGCPNADQCFAKKQKKATKVDIDLKRYERDKRRAYMQTEAFHEKKNLRPAIEGTISAMKRTGLNSIRVCGLFRVRMTVSFNAIGCNLKRLHRLCQNMRKNSNKQPLLNHAA